MLSLKSVIDFPCISFSDRFNHSWSRFLRIIRAIIKLILRVAKLLNSKPTRVTVSRYTMTTFQAEVNHILHKKKCHKSYYPLMELSKIVAQNEKLVNNKVFFYKWIEM